MNATETYTIYNPATGAALERGLTRDEVYSAIDTDEDFVGPKFAYKGIVVQVATDADYASWVEA